MPGQNHDAKHMPCPGDGPCCHACFYFAVSVGPHPAWPCVPSLFCAPGMGLAAMPVFILPCRRGQDLPFFYPAHSVSAPQPCVCFAQSAPFRRVHPLLLASNQRLRCFLAAFFCSNPCPFPSGWRMALLRLSSAIKKSPFRALFLCIYQRALPSRTSTCVNVAYLPTPPLGFRRLAMS